MSENESLDQGIKEFKEGKLEDLPGKYLEYPKQESIWKTLEMLEGGDNVNRTEALDVMGGVIVRTTYILGEHLSQSLVFLPGFEIASNGKIRKQ